MPVLYKLSQRQSSVHGTGTFTEEDIPAGSAWWVLDPSIPSVPVINAPNLPNIVYTKE